MLYEWPLAKQFPVGTRGMVATKHPRAAEAGRWALRQGGSAIDAAVATSFALSVVEGYASGIGGGGLALYRPRDGKTQAFHFGMKAPRSSTPDMYEIIPDSYDADLFGWPRTRGQHNVHGPQSIALPGQVAGLHLLWQTGGRLPWRDLLAPAARLAAEGVPVDWIISLRILYGFDLLSRFPTSREVYLPHGRPPLSDVGLGAEVLVQRDLARTLEAVAQNPTALDHGAIGRSIAAAAEGRIALEELGENQPLSGDPLAISFGDLTVHLVPWATGGASVLEWLGVLRELDPPPDEADPAFWWALVRAGEVAFADRLSRLADPEFAPFPSEILEPGYHRRAAEAIRAGEVGPVSRSLPADSTSHVSACDADGNAVTITQTLLSLWGSGVVAPNTGVCMNNGMMWFDPQPGRPNSVAGGKRPLANMCPVLATRDGETYLAYGASGGRRILPAVVQILARVALFGQSLAEAIAAPRLDTSQADVLADARFGKGFCEDLARRLGRAVVMKEPVLGGSPWASLVGLTRRDDGSWTGGGDLYTMACVLEA